LLSLGSLSGEALATYAAVGERGFATAAERTALVSGLYGRELEFLELWCTPHGGAPRAGELELAELCARCVADELLPERIQRAVAFAVRLAPAPQALAIAKGLLAAVPPDPSGAAGARGRFVIASEPAGWSSFVAALAADAPKEWRELDGALAWPTKPGVTLQPVRELEPPELARFERGRALFAATCVPCHGERGTGQPNVVPPLRASPFVLGDDARLVRIVSYGLSGPVEVRGQHFDGEMPGFATGDDELAALLTYVRRAWSHGAEPLTPERVAAVRALTAGRQRPWTIEELGAAAK
jgi:mono/diheme cytochrome c family protein